MAKVYMVLGAWAVALAFAIVALVESDTVVTTAGAEVEAKTKKQQRCNIFTGLTLLLVAATFYFALQLL
jgi:hypothetical protein